MSPQQPTTPNTGTPSTGGWNTPSVPGEMILAVVGALITTIVAFGVDITKQQEYALMAMATVLASVIVYVGGRIRKHRAENAVQIATARAIAAGVVQPELTVGVPVQPARRPVRDAPQA